MKVADVKAFFQDKGQTPCPLTEKLVKAGYQQTSGGYICRAKKEGLIVDYRNNSPSQYWHLMSYCTNRNADDTFGKSIVCGELIFWMAEVSDSVNRIDLENLADRIIASCTQQAGERPIYDRKKWNREIQEVCFDRIEETVKKKQ